MKKDGQEKKDYFHFCLRILGGVVVESRGQVPGMVLIKCYEILSSALRGTAGRVTTAFARS